MLKPNPTTQQIGRPLLWVILILAGHVGLLFAIGLMVLLYQGIATYAAWLGLGCLVLMAAGVYLAIRKARTAGQALQSEAMSPLFHNRAVEIRLLGGIVSLRTGEPTTPQPLLENHTKTGPMTLTETPDEITRDLAALSELHRKKLLTRDEYDQAKSRIFDPKGK